ncbi:TlpA family protein disulfide reductase [Arthrobacter sp. FW306-05-C]|nr:TlpA disulfide reductase family protein [Arthrobacter sp. FW306-05-C]UKA68821.1 TlpA family protein disulfide reductase [Arthrobacter sp. FW306-05-C]
MTRRRFISTALVGAAGVAALAGCSSPDALAQQAKAGDNKNYIAGDGSVTEYAAEQRTQAVVLTGKLYDGTAVSSTDWAGRVTVLNFWYAACAPCRLEAPRLEALWEQFQPDGVRFYGVNIRDEEQAATAFERTFGVTYPSMQDKDGGILLAMARYVPPQAVPSTLVLDKQGRVASRILGLADQGILKALILSALAQ